LLEHAKFTAVTFGCTGEFGTCRVGARWSWERKETGPLDRIIPHTWMVFCRYVNFSKWERNQCEVPESTRGQEWWGCFLSSQLGGLEDVLRAPLVGPGHSPSQPCFDTFWVWNSPYGEKN